MRRPYDGGSARDKAGEATVVTSITPPSTIWATAPYRPYRPLPPVTA